MKKRKFLNNQRSHFIEKNHKIDKKQYMRWKKWNSKKAIL